MRLPLISTILAGLLIATASAQDDLGRIVARLDDDDAHAREAAQADLEAWCDTAGDGATEALRAHLDGASAEVRGRLDEQLGYLAQEKAALPVLAVYDLVDRDALGSPPKDVAKACEAVLAEDWSRIAMFLGQTEAHNYRHLEKATRHARWVLDKGMRRMAVALVAKAEAWLSDDSGWRNGRRLDTSPDLREVVASVIALDLREVAIEQAEKGASREVLLPKWRRIAALPSKRWGDEARTNVEGYESLIAEDKGWRELPEDEVAALAVPAQVDYWMHQLRDIVGEPSDTRGKCELIQVFWEHGTKPTNAAEQLAALEWAALPRVIEHLDDFRPTRAMGFWKFVAAHLITYGDCCAQVFEAITGIDPEDLQRDRSETPGAAAGRWWREFGWKGQQEAFSAQLESPRDIEVATAMSWLMEKDPQRYLARAMARTAAAHPDYRYNLLSAIIPHLTKEHQEYLRAFLSEKEEPITVTLVAEGLASACDSDEGLDVIASRLLAHDHAGKTDLLERSCTLRALAGSGRPRGVDLFLRCLRDGSMPLRSGALYFARWGLDPKMAEAVAAELLDRESTGEAGADRLCDGAAQSLCQMIGEPDLFSAKGPEAQRDARIEDLKAWWIAHRDSIDWEALRRKREEAAKSSGR